jgi:hypothetical protein
MHVLGQEKEDGRQQYSHQVELAQHEQLLENGTVLEDCASSV